MHHMIIQFEAEPQVLAESIIRVEVRCLRIASAKNDAVSAQCRIDGSTASCQDSQVLQRTPKQIEREVQRIASRMIKNLNRAVAETSRIMAEMEAKNGNGGPIRRKAKQAKSGSVAGS
jgi:hypothetical protein